MPADKIAERIFNLVNQFNRGAALISDPNEKQRVAELNLHAGRKAKASTAYAAACIYLSVGSLFARPQGLGEPLRTRVQLVPAAARNVSSCAEILRKPKTSSRRCLSGRHPKADKAAAYRLRIELHIIKSEHTKAVDTALECLRLFAIQIAAHPTWEQVRTECEKVWQTLGERSIESLIDLPSMIDPEIQAAMRVLSVLYSSAFSIDIKLFYLCICHTVNLTLKHGTTDASAHGYAYFGFILGPAFHRYSDGYRFAKLGEFWGEIRPCGLQGQGLHDGGLGRDMDPASHRRPRLRPFCLPRGCRDWRFDLRLLLLRLDRHGSSHAR